MSDSRSSLVLTLLSASIAVSSCGTNPPSSFSNDGGASGSGAVLTDAAGPPRLVIDAAGAPGPPGCVNLECQVHSCGAKATTLTGKVFNPAGRNPLSNVGVYIPNSQGGQLQPIPGGINSPSSCACDLLVSGEPMVAALTDGFGNFTLTNVPDGRDIPLVVQIGKWRKEIIVPKVAPCTSNAVGKITLPKNLTDGAFASIPNIAISTGGADTLECLLTRIGVDQALFTGNPAGPGVHVFQGGGGQGGHAAAGGSPSSPTSLWDSQSDLMRYDIVMLSCEGTETYGVTGTTASYLASYVNAGGRVFAEHYHYAFFEKSDEDGGPPAAYPEFTNVADWFRDATYPENIVAVLETTLPDGAPFPQGAALKSWLGNVSALYANTGEIAVPSINARADALVTSSNLATPWAQTDPSVSPASTQYFSWDMPLDPPRTDAGVPKYCGRVVFSDMHVSGSAPDYQTPATTVPAGCAGTFDLAPDEDVIEFILFNLSSCLTPVGFTPQPPGPPR